MLVDLHMHSFFSDGTMSPEEIVDISNNRNVKIISITDHNRIEAYEEAKDKGKQLGITLIKGCEINVRFKDKILHLLAYNFENTSKLCSLIDKSYEELQKNSVDLVTKLALEDNRVSLEDYKQYEHDRRKGGWKGLHYLYERGITTKLFEGFKYYDMYGCGYENYDFPNIEEVCLAIKEANGISVLAHPGEYFKNLEKHKLIEIFEELRVHGINGIECYYPTHSEEMTDICVEFCKKHHMIITSGSDEHGEFGKESKKLVQTIGCLNIDESKLEISKILNFINK